MAAVNPPFVIQNQSHPSDDFRRMVKALREAQGVINLGDLAVSQNGTPNMSVNVAAGLVVIDGTQDATHQGSYVCLNDAVTNLTISAADPTNPRIDIVVAKVQDSQYSGGTDAWSLAVVTGTPAPSPSAPAAPANSIILAQVAVAALASSIVNANITDARPFNFNSQFPVGTTGAALAVPSAANGRYIGRWSTFGAPGALSTFLYQAGDYGFDGNGALWFCTTGGASGTWQTVPLGTLPGGYAQVTATQGTFTAQTDITGLSVTVTVGTGRRIRISTMIGGASSVASDVIQAVIMEGATQLQQMNAGVDSTGVGWHQIHGAVILSPSAGSHTYKIAMSRILGTGNVTMEAGATFPSYILVEDIGV